MQKFLQFIIAYTVFQCTVVLKTEAQQLLKSIPVVEATIFSTDELGNVYVVQKDRSITKWNRDGDSLTNFRMIKNGPVHTIDASNPLELFVIQPTFNRLTILDRMMAPKMELDISGLGVYNITGVGQSRDGNFWVYDNVSNQLKKVDQQLNIVAQSNDLRAEQGISLAPYHLEERSDRVVISDPAQGIFIFDRYATFVQQLEMKNVTKFQLVGHILAYYAAQKIHVYDFEKKRLQELPVPELDQEILDARVELDRLYMLTPSGLYIYDLELNEH